jgi:hypothetical protein
VAKSQTQGEKPDPCYEVEGVKEEEKEEEDVVQEVIEECAPLVGGCLQGKPRLRCKQNGQSSGLHCKSTKLRCRL